MVTLSSVGKVIQLFLKCSAEFIVWLEGAPGDCMERFLFRVQNRKLPANLKGPVKLIKRVRIAHSFLVCVKSVPRYHFKLAYVILQMAVKEFFETHF